MGFLSNLFGGIWVKAKVVAIIAAIILLFWQVLTVTSLQRDVATLEGEQSKLQVQLQQVQEDYKQLSLIAKQDRKTSEEFIEAQRQTASLAIGLEKSIAGLEAQKNSTVAFSPATNTIARGDNEKRTTEAPRGLPDNSGDAEWKRLLDDTYCNSFPNECRGEK